MTQRTAETHYLSLVIPSLRKHADALAFRPYLGRNDAWGSVTYRELEHRLAVTRAHWQRTFDKINLQPLDVVGLWLTGRKFSDLLNNLAISSLGYTPQLFGSGDFTNASVIVDLLLQSGGKALVIDPSHLSMVPSSDAIPVPQFPPFDDEDMLQIIAGLRAAGDESALTFGPDSVVPVGRDDLAVLFHSSGTTGGMPKIIPNTYKMIQAVIQYKLLGTVGLDEPPYQQQVLNTIGSTAHIASFHIFLGQMFVGGCMVQSSSTAISTEEFMGMHRVCGLSHLVIFATFLSDIIRAAMKDDSVKTALQELTQISHTGVALNKEADEWAHSNGIKLVTSYSTTETGPLMRTRRGADPSSRLLRPIKGTTPVFQPYENTEESDVKLYEVVVPAEADDCPPSEYCQEDGYYHTKDIFERIEDGYVYRGRVGDWIKTVEGFVDTKTIEDMVRKSCTDIVHDVVVVGTGKLFPCLIVESVQTGLDEHGRNTIANTIVEKTSHYQDRLFPHERIQDPRRILVVNQGTLIRTSLKGNVRRPATEALFAKELDTVYGLI